MKFSTFVNEKAETEELLSEVMINLTKKNYPDSGQVLILAGGAGSGKGFVIDKLIGLEGKTLDVDALKVMALKSGKVQQKAKDEFGIDLSTMDLRKPENVSKLHAVIKGIGLNDKKLGGLFASILSSHPDRRPNLIFDVTLDNITKLHNIAADVNRLGYKKENVHIVWVVNDVEVAKQQNQERDRVVPEDILVDTHRGASLTMKTIIDMGDKVKKYMDGSIVLAFNKRGVDSEVKTSDKGGFYVVKANYLRVKQQGKSINKNAISKEVISKIVDYTPEIHKWDEEK